MTARDRLADARSLLAAATTAADVELRTVFAARAHSMLVELRRDVDGAWRDLAAVEAELVRLTNKPAANAAEKGNS